MSEKVVVSNPMNHSFTLDKEGKEDNGSHPMIMSSHILCIAHFMVPMMNDLELDMPMPPQIPK